MVINDYEGNEEGSQEVSLPEALAPHPPTFKLPTTPKIEVCNTLREILDVSWEREHCQQQYGDQL